MFRRLGSRPRPRPRTSRVSASTSKRPRACNGPVRSSSGCEIYLARAERERKTAIKEHADRVDDLADLLGCGQDPQARRDVVGTLNYAEADIKLPPDDVLIAEAIRNRPDLVALRLGLRLAEANVRLMKANRYEDVYLLYQPYTFLSNAGVAPRSAYAWRSA